MGAIYFNGTVQFNAKAHAVYETIANNAVGRVIVDQIKKTDHDLTFMPPDPRLVQRHGSCNLETKTLKRLDAAPDGIGRGNALLYDDNGQPVPATAVTPAGKVVDNLGTGKGSDVEIYFDAEGYVSSRCHQQGPGSLLDETLLHEMVHALRSMQGKHNPIPIPNNPESFRQDNDGYDTEEEFLSIVVANVYISGKGGTQFRAGHHGHHRLKPPLDTSAGFVSEPIHHRLLSIYRMVWSGPFIQLSLVQTTFNPFRHLALSIAPFGHSPGVR